MPWTTALLVPITSRLRSSPTPSTQPDPRPLLGDLLRSIAKTASPDAVTVLFGVDVGDPVYDPALTSTLAAQVAEHIPLFVTSVHRFALPRGKVCALWRELALLAFKSGADVALLVGDDVVLETPAWPDIVRDAIRSTARDAGLPLGFSCVALADRSFPGFPTFPVLHRTVTDVLGEEFFLPPQFVNQDYDPFIYEVFNRFGASRILPSATLLNRIGGSNPSRYDKVHVDWTSDALLGRAVRRAAAYLDSLGVPRAPKLAMDVVVPTYRAVEANLEGIIQLEVPPNVVTRFVIVFDNPRDPRCAALFEEWTARFATNAQIRVRLNEHNLGAAATRNRGLNECVGDYVVFLDDDVVPEPGLLSAYARAARDRPEAPGFVGPTVLPPPLTTRQTAVHRAGISYFWLIANRMPNETKLPWGITANLCFRRVPGLVFREDVFPKAGGGEDIDFCLRLTRALGGEGLVATPDAVARHPYWDDGACSLAHFMGWSRGDGALIDLYPELSYSNWPELSEALLACFVAGVLRPERSLIALAVAAVVVVGDLAQETFACGSASLAAQVVLVRAASEFGRLLGHAERRRLPWNLGRRFNWFGTMWPGAVRAERDAALTRWAWRTGAGLCAALLWRVL